MLYEKIINKFNKIKIVFCILFLLVGFSLRASQEEGDKDFITPQIAQETMPFVSAASHIERNSDGNTYLKSKKGLDKFKFDLKETDGNEVIGNMKEKIQDLIDNSLDGVEKSDIEAMKSVVGILQIDPLNKSVIIDQGTGLRFTLLEYGEQYILAFGSTFSDRLKSPECYDKDYSDNSYFVCPIWDKLPFELFRRIGADLTPDWFSEIYQQAKEIVGVLKLVYEDKDITTTGHSLGGALAVWSAANNGLPAKAFNPVSFSTSMAEEIRCASNIKTFIVEGDWWVSDNLLTGEHIGKQYSVKSIDCGWLCSKYINFGYFHMNSWYFIANAAEPSILRDKQNKPWKEKTKILRENVLENFKRRGDNKKSVTESSEEQVDFNNVFKDWTDAIKELEDEELMEQKNDELVNIIAADENNNMKLIIKKIDSGELTKDQHIELIMASCRQKNTSLRKKLVKKYRQR